MLQLSNLHAFYGKSHILHGVDMNVGKGEIVSLLGRNGAGRSTTVKTIMGLVDGEGSIKFQDEEILGHHAFDIAHRGVGYVPENRDIFPKLTVEQNLMLGEKRGKRSPRWSFGDMYRMFPRLQERQHTEAGVLSGGEQQMLTLGRALARPGVKVLLADELSLGLAPKAVTRLLRAVRQAADDGVGVLLVEQHVHRVLEIADRVHVLAQGRVRYSADAAQARERIDEIQSHYLSVVAPEIPAP